MSSKRQYIKVEAVGDSLKYTRTTKKQTYEDLENLCTTKEGQTKILSRKLKFPLQVRSTGNVAVDGIEGITEEKLFRCVMKRGETEFAAKLVKEKIIPVDMDIISTCCRFPSPESMSILAEIINEVYDIYPGVWQRTWDQCLSSLMNHSTFTDAMQENAIGLLERGADMTCECFRTLLSNGYLTSTKMTFMLEHGLDLNLNTSSPYLPKPEFTYLSLLTHGIPLNEFVEIMILINQHQNK